MTGNKKTRQHSFCGQCARQILLYPGASKLWQGYRNFCMLSSCMLIFLPLATFRFATKNQRRDVKGETVHALMRSYIPHLTRTNTEQRISVQRTVTCKRYCRMRNQCEINRKPRTQKKNSMQHRRAVTYFVYLHRIRPIAEGSFHSWLRRSILKDTVTHCKRKLGQ